MTTATATKIDTTASGHRTVTHGTFTLERMYPASRQQVFDAWSSRDAKDEWFASGIDFLRSVTEYRLDFRVGGEERLDGILRQSGNRFEYTSTYGDIVEDQRIVASYDVLINGRRISVSLMTVEFEDGPDGGTRLVLTEQGAFLDGHDTNDERLVGATSMLDNLEAFMDRQ